MSNGRVGSWTSLRSVSNHSVKVNWENKETTRGTCCDRWLLWYKGVDLFKNRYRYSSAGEREWGGEWGGRTSSTYHPPLAPCDQRSLKSQTSPSHRNAVPHPNPRSFPRCGEFKSDPRLPRVVSHTTFTCRVFMHELQEAKFIIFWFQT